jgi:hypothetical protein
MDFKQKLPEEIKSLHIIKENNPSRRYNDSNYICTGHWFPNFIKQTFLNIKGKTGPDTIVVSDLITPLSSSHIISRQKISKDILELNSTVHEKNLTDIYRVFHPASILWNFLPSRSYLRS